MNITDKDGYTEPLDRRLAQLIESPNNWVIGELLELLIVKSGITEAELHACSILEDDETIAPEPA